MSLAIDLIRAACSRVITGAELAGQVGLSHFHFVRLFRKETGLTPGGFLVVTRCSEAARLLTTSRLSIKEIGYEVGFRTPAGLSRAFKAAFGCSPSEYRTRIRTATTDK